MGLGNSQHIGVRANTTGLWHVLLIFGCCVLQLWAGTARSADSPEGQRRGHVASLLRDGKLAAEAENWAKATGILTEAHRLAPGSEEIQFALGTCRSQVGQYEGALAILEPLLAKHPDSPSLKNNIAWIYLKATEPALRDVNKALTLAREAAVEAESGANEWGTLAEAHFACGEYEMAFRACRIAILLSTATGSGDSDEYWELMRRCEKAVGRRASGVTGGEENARGER